MNEVREFCITNKLGPEITTPIVRFFCNLYPNETIIDEDAFLGELPGSLRKKVVMRLYAEVIRRVPLFKTLDEDATVAICTALRPLERIAPHVFLTVVDDTFYLKPLMRYNVKQERPKLKHAYGTIQVDGSLSSYPLHP